VLQIHDLEGLSHEEAAVRVAASFQTMMGHLPPDSLAFIPQLACIPGCIMLLAKLVVPSSLDIAGEAEDQLRGGEADGEVFLQVGQQGWDDIMVYAGLNHTAAPEVAAPLPQVRNGAWHLKQPGGMGGADTQYLQFASISSFEAAVEGGLSLQGEAAGQGVGDCGAHSSNNVAAMTHAAAASCEADPVVAAAWGGRLQLSVAFPAAAAGGANMDGTSNNFVNSHTVRVNGAACSSTAVRVVLLQGAEVVLDQEVEAAMGGSTLSLQLRLPDAGSVGACDDQPGAAALYILPAASSNSTGSSTGGYGNGSSNVGPVIPHLVQVSVLLLPLAAASELEQWVEQEQLTQRHVQPLLEDMLAAVEAHAALTTSASSALTAAAANGECVPCSLSSVFEPAAGAGGVAALLEFAAVAADRVVGVFGDYGLGLCEDVMAVCKQQLLVALRTVHPLAAGTLELPEPGLAAAAVGGTVSESKAGPAGGKATASAVAVGRTATCKLSKADGGFRVEGEGSGTMKLDGRDEAEIRLCRKAAVAATAASFWWYVGGALVGWRDQELEQGYVRSRLRRSSRPAVWMMMGIIDVFFHVWTGGRVLLNLMSGLYTAPAMLAGARLFSVASMLLMLPGWWLMLVPAKWWSHVGAVAIAAELLRVASFQMHAYMGGFDALQEIIRHATNKTSPAYAMVVLLFTVVRIVLHQLPPPWLVSHALVSGGVQWWVYTNTPMVWTPLFPLVAPLLQLLLVSAVGVGVVVAQEAAGRVKYIRSQARLAHL
jgi:hypothetical protein